MPSDRFSRAAAEALPQAVPINAARSNLPSDLSGNPTYRKVNPADSPILIISLTSDSATPGQMYDVASTLLEQKLLQTTGVGDVGAGARP